MNTGTAVVLLILLAVAWLAVRTILKDRKAGKPVCGCGGNCKGCAGGCC